ncbi:MAG: hypothetical protein R2764_00810 [Bacteroidales bacterium]
MEEFIGPFEMNDCFEEFTLCIATDKTYNLVASNGIIFPNAIVNGVVTYRAVILLL